MKNKVEIRDGKVIKTFTNRADYLNEDYVYKQLKGSGLAPELLWSYDCCIEHAYVEGEHLYDILQASMKDLAKVSELLDSFCEWYLAFHEKTGMILGNIRFDKFVLSGGRLIYLDFESCRRGYIESDFASLFAGIIMRPAPFSEKGMLVARTLACIIEDRIKWDPKLLEQQLSYAIERECAAAGIPMNVLKAEYIITGITSAGLILAGGPHPVDDCAKALSNLPERVISVPQGVSSPVAGGFKTVVSSYPESCASGRIAEALEKIRQPWTLVLSTSMPMIPPVLWRALLSELKSETDAVMVEAGGKLRNYPVLLRTETALPELKLAALQGRDTVVSAMSGRRIKVIKLGDLEGRRSAF